MSVSRKTGVIHKVLSTLDEIGIGRSIENAKILIGFSGGPDSTCLVHVISHLKQAWNSEVTCCYVDHGIRSRHDIDEDLRFVRRVTDNLNLELIIRTIPFGMIQHAARSRHESLENVARKMRYTCFEDVAVEKNIEFIGVGHNLDDHMETLVMRFFQGVDFTGFAGIPNYRGKIIRPLIDCRREEILDYLQKNNITYRTDATNTEPYYLRNKVRLKLMPVIAEVFPHYRSSIHRTARKADRLKRYFDDVLAEEGSWEQTRCGYCIDAAKFLLLPGVFRIQLVFKLYDEMAKNRATKATTPWTEQLGTRSSRGEHSRLPYRFLESLLDDEFVAHKSILLSGHNIRLVRRGGKLFLERNIVTNSKKGYLIIVAEDMKGEFGIPGAGVQIVFGKSRTIRGTQDVYLPANLLKPPVIVRSRKTSDKIQLTEGSKQLKKLYNEWKIPMAQRWIIPVVADREGIVGVFGKTFGYRNSIRKTMAVDGGLSESGMICISFKRNEAGQSE